MKIKRKLYPNSNDKEFVLMSINDLKQFSSHMAFFSGPDENDAINEFLKDFNLKTPVSHQKRDKKVKSEERVNS